MTTNNDEQKQYQAAFEHYTTNVADKIFHKLIEMHEGKTEDELKKSVEAMSVYVPVEIRQKIRSLFYKYKYLTRQRKDIEALAYECYNHDEYLQKKAELERYVASVPNLKIPAHGEGEQVNGKL